MRHANMFQKMMKFLLFSTTALLFLSLPTFAAKANKEWRRTRITSIHLTLTSSVSSESDRAHLEKAFDWVLSVKFPLRGDARELIRIYYLALLYYSTNGPSWIVRRGWLVHPDACTWYGIDCTVDGGMPYEAGKEKDYTSRSISKVRLQYNDLSGSTDLFGHVVAYLCSEAEDLWMLDFGNNELLGTIPRHMFVHSGLNHLNLRANRLVGPLPVEIGRVATLREVSLADNELTGTIPYEIIASMQVLKALWLSNNRFVGTISGELGRMENLDYLYLDMNDLHGSIPEEIGKIESLSKSGNILEKYFFFTY
uniref:Leucine-rich repeat-containing N-terminal plant-type domain-containing protein n=1 Tax=Corethron hystrix TaxID=216773 RepID=A0A7S1FMX6_9STRA|mmetsp:Transcript_147/g.328  ORF Transcript_147/g.328 Transcript_147/m.328 type:complete len:310 (+) Transcript_147:62-991(+)